MRAFRLMERSKPDAGAGTNPPFGGLRVLILEIDRNEKARVVECAVARDAGGPPYNVRYNNMGNHIMNVVRRVTTSCRGSTLSPVVTFTACEAERVPRPFTCLTRGGVAQVVRATVS